jgi:hypothetical protein
MPCQFPEHHGHGSVGIPAGAVAVLAAAVVAAECVSHAAAIVTALAVVLAVLAVVAVAVVLVVRRVARSRACMIVRPGLPPATVRAVAVARVGCVCPLPYYPGGPVPCVAAGRCMRPAASEIAARQAELARLPAPTGVRAIAPPARQVVTAEILEVRRDAPRPGA